MTIAETFRCLGECGELALIAYVTAGYPTLEESLRSLQMLAAAGADLLEVGIPFSDPVADGPTIQHASHVALQQGITLALVLDRLATRPPDKPLLLMSYLNPLLAMGADRLFPAMQRAHMAGLIVPDLPMEESRDWADQTRHQGINLIPMIAPTTSDVRLELLTNTDAPFLYGVSVTGTTGSRNGLGDETLSFLDRVKRRVSTPLAVGFGISSPQAIRRLHAHADAVVVGSRLIEAIRQNEDLYELVRRLKAATTGETQCSSS